MNTIEETLNETLITIIVANTYFDFSDMDDPVKTYVKYSQSIPYRSDRQTRIEMSIKPSEIRYLDGSTDMVYELTHTNHLQRLNPSYIFGIIDFKFGPYYEVYQLEEDFAENLEKEVHHPIFIMAQIGGLYSFLKLIFDIIIAPIYKKTLIMQIINSYKARRQYHLMKSQKSSHTAQQYASSSKEESKVHEGGSSDENEDIAKSIRRGKRLDVSDSNDSIQNRFRSNRTNKSNSNHPKVSYYDYKDALYDTFACCCRRMSTKCIDLDNLKTRNIKFQNELARFEKESDILQIVDDIKQIKLTVNDLIVQSTEVFSSISTMK